MTGARFRTIGLTLLTGAALAVACGGDDSGDDDDDGSATGTPTSTTGTPTSTTTQTQSATSSGTSTGTTGSTTGSTTGTGGSAGTGAGGTAGAGGECMDDEPMVTTGGAGEGGAAGAAGAGTSDVELTGEGWNFVSASELDDWAITPCADDATNCVDGDDASISWACGVLQVTVNWPEAANTAPHSVQIENLVPEDMLREMDGLTVVARARMTSDWVDGDGYDFNIVAQDNPDWGWHATCLDSSGAPCAVTPGGSFFAPEDGWVTAMLPITEEAAPDGFQTDGIRKFVIEIASKHWADGEPFTYDSAPTSFEIDYFVW